MPGGRSRSLDTNRDLRIRTKRFALSVIDPCTRLPRTDVARTLGRQLVRSGTSPGAQYREAHRAKSTADFISKIEGVLQELDETTYWLELLQEAGIVPEPELRHLRSETDELISIFVTVVRAAKRRQE